MLSLIGIMTTGCFGLKRRREILKAVGVIFIISNTALKCRDLANIRYF